MGILVVDDDNVSLLKMKAILSHYGEVDLVESGVEGLERIKNAYEQKMPYNFCTMDIEMPGMDGMETVEKIRTLEKEMNIRIRHD